MNPNAAAFSLILKQREAQANAMAAGGAPMPQAYPGMQFYGQHNMHSNMAGVPSAQYYPPPVPQPYYGYPAMQTPYLPGQLSQPFAPQPTVPPPMTAATPFMAPQYPSFYQGVQRSFQANAMNVMHAKPPPPHGSGHNRQQSQRPGAKPPAPRTAPNAVGMVNIPVPAPAPVESTVYYCEPCDKEFTQLSAFDTHKASHETCRHPGCNFNATKKVVMAHYHGAHGQFSGTGYKTIDVEGQQFCVLMGQSPEEIAQWRADRRKKFPTAEVEEQKKKEAEALAEVGGIPVPKSKGKFGEKKRALAGSSSEASSKVPRLGEGSEGAEAIVGGADNGENAEGEEGGARVGSSGKRRCIHWGRGRCKAGDACTFSHDFEPRQCEAFLRGFCKHSFKCYNVHDTAKRAEMRANGTVPAATGESGNKQSTAETGAAKGKTTESKNKRNANGELSIPAPLAGGERGTLWRKLLEDEINREENVVLQCLRYLVQNNFLDEPPPRLIQEVEPVA